LAKGHVCCDSDENFVYALFNGFLQYLIIWIRSILYLRQLWIVLLIRTLFCEYFLLISTSLCDHKHGDLTVM